MKILLKKFLNFRTAIVIAMAGVLGIFVFWPMGHVMKEAFWVDGRLSLTFFSLLWENPLLTDSVVNSLMLAVCATLGCIAIAVPLALVFHRYRFPGKSILMSVVLVPLILPPFVGALGLQQWLRNYGVVNLVLMHLGIVQEPIDFLGEGGMLGVVWVQMMHVYPVLFLHVLAALSHMDVVFEEAAVSLGASRWRMLRTIIFPLMRPGCLAGAGLVFIWALTDLGSPLMFNYQAVLPVQIYNMVNDVHANPMGYVLVVMLVLMTATFFILSRWRFAHHRSMASHRGYTPRMATPIRGAKRWAVYGGIGVIAFLALLPHMGVFLHSISERWVMTIVPDRITYENYTLLFSESLATQAIQTSMILSGLSTLVDMVVGLLVAYVLVRRPFWGSGLLEMGTMIPLAIPGVVLAFGYVALFSGTIWDPRYSPIPLLTIAYAIRRMPIMVRSAVSGFSHCPVVLEEASLSVGAGIWRTYWRVTMPLMLAHVVAGALMCFAYAMLEVSSSLILAMQESFYPITKAIYMLISLGDNLASAMGMVGTLILAVAIWGASRLLGGRMGSLFRIGDV